MAKLTIEELDGADCSSIHGVCSKMPNSEEIFPVFYDSVNQEYLTLEFISKPYSLSNKELVVYGDSYDDNDFNSIDMADRLYEYPWTEVYGHGGYGYGYHNISEYALLLVENFHKEIMMVGSVKFVDETPVFNLVPYKDLGKNLH